MELIPYLEKLLIPVSKVFLISSAIVNLITFMVHPITLIFLVIRLCYLMLSELKLISLKFKTYDFATNKARYILLGISAGLLVLLKFKALPLIILAYVIISLTVGKEEKH